MNPRDLEPEQLQLLSELVEADRSLPRDQRDSFYFIETMGAGGFLVHPALRERSNVLRSDLLSLHEAGLLRMTSTSGGGFRVDIRPTALRFHAERLQRMDEPLAHLEAELPRHLNASAFRTRYAEPYAKWIAARDLLYSDDAHDHLTRIGHDCTEALQLFASRLVELHSPPGAESNPSLYVRRLDAVVDLFRSKVGARRTALLHALVNYWVAASALAERQEHGLEKAGDPVTWEDARRVVFHTSIVMFEIDRTLTP